MRLVRAGAVLYILSAGIVTGQNRGAQLPLSASQQTSGPTVASPTQSNRQAQEVRTYVDVGVSLNTVVDQVKAAFLAERLSIAGSSAAGVVASDPMVKNPAARFPYTEVYRAVITQTDSGGVSVRLSGTGQNGSAPPYALTSEMVSQNPGPNDSAWALLERLAARLKGAGGPGDARPSAPVVAAFRETARDVAERIRLAADAMPAEQYNVRAAPSLPTFAETVFRVGLMTDDVCSRLGRVPRPERTPVSSTSSKTSLVDRAAEAFQFCDQVTASVPDSDLANPIQFTFHPGPEPAPRVPRAQALMLLTAYWADVYAQLARSVRLVGRVPPEVCRGGDKVDWNLNPLCDSGFIICKDVGGGRYDLTFTLSDSTYSITSDGKGPYRPVGNVRVVAQRPVGLLMFANPAADSASHRSIRLDLSRPVPGDIGVPRGVVVADRDVELSAQVLLGARQHGTQRARDSDWHDSENPAT